MPRPYLLFVGTLEPRKNVVTLVRAYRQVAPDVPHALVLTGPDGWFVAEMDRELARTGPGHVVRTGLVDAADLDALYRGADAFVYPSAYEGFGLPVLEALARGSPRSPRTYRRCARWPGTRRCYVEPGDVADPGRGARPRADRRAAGRGPASSRPGARGGFTWAATARATLEAYRRAAGSARAGEGSGSQTGGA